MGINHGDDLNPLAVGTAGTVAVNLILFAWWANPGDLDSVKSQLLEAIGTAIAGSGHLLLLAQLQ